MDGWADQQQLLLLFALILLAAWALGGGFEFKGFKVREISTTSRVLSVVTGGGLLLIWLALVISSQELSDLPGQEEEGRAAPFVTRAPEVEVLPTREPPVAVSRDVQAELEEAIELASLGEVLAYQMGNPDYFLGYFKGQALDEMAARFADVSAAGLGRETYHQSWAVDRVEFSADGNTADAEILITASYQYVFWNPLTGLLDCSASLDGQGIRVPVRLERGRAGMGEADWVISDIDLQERDRHETFGC
jgi:hypothetical protein